MNPTTPCGSIPGWKIRGIQLQGPDWQWVACPRSGAGTASFSIRIRAWKTVDTPRQGTVVTLQGLTLEGPAGATDWKAAFPDLRPAGLDQAIGLRVRGADGVFLPSEFHATGTESGFVDGDVMGGIPWE